MNVKSSVLVICVETIHGCSLKIKEYSSETLTIFWKSPYRKNQEFLKRNTGNFFCWFLWKYELLPLHFIFGYLYFPALALCLNPGLDPGPGPQFVFTGTGPQLVFTGPGTQFVFTDPVLQFVFKPWSTIFIYRSWPQICVYRPWPQICNLSFIRVLT